MSKKALLLTALATSALLFSPLAVSVQAHNGFYHVTGGFLMGIEHPLTGWDHLLAMVAVGLWASQIGGRAIWALPLSFVGSMVLGGVAGAFGCDFPFTEWAIVLSILLLASGIFTGTRLALLPSLALVGICGMYHGLAHGSEMPHSTDLLSYAAGFALTTSGLHLAGIGAALTVQRYSDNLLRWSGLVIGLGGLAVATNLI
jgi:urease accessory protein